MQIRAEEESARSSSDAREPPTPTTHPKRPGENHPKDICKQLILNPMVEAGGVEPPSEEAHG